MLKEIFKILLFLDLFKKILGDYRYNLIKHTIRYHLFFPLNYTIKDEINFGSTKANDFFKNELKNSKIYLEYGTGASTLLAEKEKKNYFAIEGDRNFYKYMNKRLKKNNIKLKSLGVVKEFCIPVKFKSDYDLRKINNKERKDIKNYCNGILEEFEKENIIPDLILVDGRFRKLTGLYLYNFFKNKNNNFKIIIDDYLNRENYHELEKFFVIKKFERFGVSTELIPNMHTEDAIEKSLYDCG